MASPRQGQLTHEALAACVEWLEKAAEDRSLLADIDRDLRKRLVVAAGRVSRPERNEQRNLRKALAQRDRRDQKAADQQARGSTVIRALRELPVYPTPPLELGVTVSSGPTLLGISSGEPQSAEPSQRTQPGEKERRLIEPEKCYVCKAPYDKLHFFYDQLCPECGDLNYQKRLQTANLTGRVAIVTGARVKIGYQAAVKLLRAGARVIVTTRFPHDAARRYAEESDYNSFADRLQIYGLDLRHTPSVERFTSYLNAKLDRLDFVLHNACQTVRRPPGFYAHLMERELLDVAALPPKAAHLVHDYHTLKQMGEAPRLTTHGADMGLKAPALLSQIAAVAGDLVAPDTVFPEGKLDQDEQQIDLRSHNSWRLLMHEVPTVELFEVMLVNAIAPFVMSARLKELMEKHPTGDKHIVNVSAMEGQFYRAHKTDKHPHTNMAKAALNMMTRTSAVDYLRSGIHMNSVDTGWVTDEDPVEIAVKKVQEHGFHPPLDIVDGAARICDPIFSGLLSGKHAAGLFFKDYRATDW
ncbi:MAG: SDR family oxidoreductase [Polyangiaceae bacterium]|nr:SDR family oxidoreductase [Polyangiaceae bacterium]